MRTTVNIDDQLLRELKIIAAREDRTIGSVLEDALRAHLESEAVRPTVREPWPTFIPSKTGLRAGIDLEDRHAIMDLLDGIEPSH